MARHSANSLKVKIWLATSALTFFICTFGIGSYLIVGIFTDNSLNTILVQFLFLALAILVFGWWLSNEVVSPIEKVTLLSKSLERGVSISLPKTSGSSETDELLQTLHRNNQQLHNLVNLMDRVAGGDLNVALTPLQNSDRLSSAFQKLLAKVAESIQAKKDLERMQAAVKNVSEEIAQLENGNLEAEISSDFGQTREISGGLRFLINRLNELVTHARNDSQQAQTAAAETKKLIRAAIATDENRIQQLTQAKIALKQIPQSVQKISDELLASAANADQSIERARSGSLTAQENLNVVGELRRRMHEAVTRIGRLDERAQEVGKIAKTVEDLTQRTNMIALNASIQAGRLSEREGRGFAVFAEEVARLSARASETNKQISKLNKTLASEIGEIENSVQESVGEIANLSRFALETSNSLTEIEKYIGNFINLHKKLKAYSGEQTAETERAFESFVASIGEAENAVGSLKETETQIEFIANAMAHLHRATADFKIANAAGRNSFAKKNLPANESAQLTAANYLHDLS